MEYVVRTNQLTKRIRGNELVSNVNLHIKKGEIYGFLGQNGAGKTTIMKMLTGLISPTGGEIELFGKKLTNTERASLQRVGSIIEYPIFFDHLTAMQNLQLHCEYLGFYDFKAIMQALDMVHLTGIEDKVVKEFSLGMKQRLGIVRAIITKPELIILDEPTNGLDPIGIKDMRDLIRMLNNEYGMTFLLSSHNLGEIEQVADRIGVIKNGKLVNEVTLAEISKQRTDYIEIVTKDVEKSVYLLEHKLRISNMKIVPDNKIRIYDLSVPQSEISKTLILHDIDIDEIQKHTSSLEDYFYQQIHGGGKVG
ncbi:ABC-2 type transport system ATP-binding protein [Cytobacillus horneckiae]|uniref:ABC transporter ATP-binding protein n=1 Tax=Cytobacillus horneckiae TaxID=549687 RepID=A0A2N0Z9X3_9BACI|nr:ABC transporter ATP-binding protein [Cytobacillus horneckiae]MBN6886469.1 ABC transporter ATP-binding protein [Cytobacillus horneckiae]MCM3176709.1 ABC transporter ATP-binding protein [Cytobacillus horneckiae]MEC1158454.1 ABC transporter ATP-binding protein [Cytobacillus horneckiae]MED2939557.1 ABC transporter ATP-binding protein [Cytobacillus horneckiae]PKG26316.1 ABC transporter ATP-binding protein [Cytobacillus horneckiae]